MMPSARSFAISALTCASDGAPGATRRLPEPAGRRSAEPTLPLTSRAAACGACGGAGSPAPLEFPREACSACACSCAAALDCPAALAAFAATALDARAGEPPLDAPHPTARTSSAAEMSSEALLACLDLWLADSLKPTANDGRS